MQQLGLRIRPIKHTPVHLADGSPQTVIGFVEVRVKYLTKDVALQLFIIPSLSQELYLGIDFWNKVGLAPMLVEELSIAEPNSVAPMMHELTNDEKTALDNIKSEFLSSAVVGLGKTTLLKHKIDTGDTEPIKQRHHMVSHAIQKILHAEVDTMLERGVIEESASPWCSPVLLVKKANGKLRFCLDCRAVNKATKKDAYPMPIIESIFASLQETHFITSLDLKDAYWQVELDKESREKTAFVVPGRPLYQFRRMPFGLCNAPQTMCRLMDRVIPSHLREFVFVYLDDLLVVSKTFEQHLDRLSIVAKCLREANLTLNIEKSSFCMREVKYLGHIVGNGCIKPDPTKVDAVENFPVPRTVRQVRRFLGMCGWYARYISGFAGIAAPLTDLLKKMDRFTWTEQAKTAFETLKRCLISAPVLTHPDFSKPYCIQSDASNTGIGGVLFQIDDDGAEHPIAYMSRKLNSAQRNYSVTELECLAAVESLKKFRGYVEGMPFKIITDHASLKWLMTQKELSGRLARWSMMLQGFNFTMEHRKGSENTVPDALSRVHVDEITVNNAASVDLDHEAFNSPAYEKLKTDFRENKSRFPDLEIRGMHLYIRTRATKNIGDGARYTWRLWIPDTLVNSVIASAHDPPLSAHSGIGKTLEKLKRTFYWPKMIDSVVSYVKKCTICKESKAPNVILRPQMGKQISVERPWQRLYIDLLGPYPRSKLGNTSLLIVLDQFSKFVMLKPLKKATALEIVRFLEANIFHVFSVPESMWSDNGVQFLSKEFQALMNKYQITHITTATHSPQSNASERVNRSILAAVRSYITTQHDTWDEHISAISSALRNNSHDSTGQTPHYLVFGQQFIQHGSCYRLLRELEMLPDDAVDVLPPEDFRILIHEDVRKRLRAAYQRHERTYNTRTRNIVFREGQEVFRRNFQLSDFEKGINAKLGKQWVKARITKRVGNAMYELEDMAGKALKVAYHAKDLKM